MLCVEDSSPHCRVFRFSIFRPGADFIAPVCSLHSSLQCQTIELKGFIIISTGLRARSSYNRESATSEDQTLLLDKGKTTTPLKFRIATEGGEFATEITYSCVKRQ